MYETNDGWCWIFILMILIQKCLADESTLSHLESNFRHKNKYAYEEDNRRAPGHAYYQTKDNMAYPQDREDLSKYVGQYKTFEPSLQPIENKKICDKPITQKYERTINYEPLSTDLLNENNNIDSVHDHIDPSDDVKIRIKRDLHDIIDNSVDNLLSDDDVFTSNRMLNENSKILSNNYYERILPTRTQELQNINESDHSGEELRVLSKGRSLLTRPKNLNFNNVSQQEQEDEVTPRSGNGGQQYGSKNPDFQDILTGFVKLLNGQTNGRPSMPTRTRINNRGPPRITDVPPIIFDSPQPQVPLPSAPVPFIPLQTTSDFPYTFENIPQHSATDLIFPSNGADVSKLESIIKPTKPIANMQESSLHIFNQRPSLEYLNPSKLPTLPDQHPHRPNPYDQSAVQKPSYVKPDHKLGKPDHNNNINSQKPIVRPESNGYRPDFIEPTKQQPNKSNQNGHKNNQNNNHGENNNYNLENIIKTNETIENLKNQNELINKINESETNRPNVIQSETIETNRPNLIKSENRPNLIKAETTETNRPNLIKSEDNSNIKKHTTPDNKIHNFIPLNEINTELNTPNINSNLNKVDESIRNTTGMDEKILNIQTSSVINTYPMYEASNVFKNEYMVNVNEKEHHNMSQGSISGSKNISNSVKISDQFFIDPTPTLPTKVSLGSSTKLKSSSEINELSQGIASVIEGLLEPSLVDTKVKSSKPIATPPVKRPPSGGAGYFPRPGIVLDDTEYTPGLHRRPHPPAIITAGPPTRVQGDIFDVTVSAIQGPGGANDSKTGQAFVYPVELEGGTNSDVITTAQNGQHFVSIDGKRTYMNMFGGPPSSTQNLPIKPSQTAGSYAANQLQTQPVVVSPTSNTATRLPSWRRPTHPPVRIDTCIVGDDSTCDTTQHERCRTEVGVSSCHCRPGYSRRKHREPCHRIVSIGMSLRVDKLYEQRLTWSDKFKDQETEEFQRLEYESIRAMDSALSMTPFSDIFLNVRINNMYPAKNNGITLNMTLQLAENAETLRPSVTNDISKHIQGVLHRRNNNLGNSAIYIDNMPGAVSLVQDVNECISSELNDCHPGAKCANVFGSFQCTCAEGYRDPWVGNLHKSGRICESCDSAHCNHRGECSYQNGQPICKCSGSFYGSQCEIDGEVLGVAIGASVCALLIILVTLICLCSWSRRWNREQKIGSPVFGYMPQGGSTVKTPSIGGPPYQVSLEDRLRWAQIADAMAHANHYAPEPVSGTMNSTRPSSAMFGYSIPHHPIPLPRLRPPINLRTTESSTSEEEDRTDLLGRNFQVPRPKSRSSVANQSGIYYDVDYEQQADVFSQKSHPSCIPLNTYTMGSRSHYYRS